MHLLVALPHRVFLEKFGVIRIIAESSQGSFGILPNRLDGVTDLIPGILIYETEEDGEFFIAIDEGSIIKTGDRVVVAVHNAIKGSNLEHLHERVETDFISRNQEEKNLHNNLAKLEMDFIRRFSEVMED